MQKTKTPDSIFETLRVNRTFENKAVPKGGFYFQIFWEQDGAYLQTVGSKGEPIDLDHRALRGVDRSLVKTMESAKKNSDWRIDWGARENTAIPLEENGALLAMLQRSERLVDHRLQSLTIDPHLYTLELELEASTGSDFEGQLWVVTENGKRKLVSNPKVIHPEYLLSDQTLYRVHPIGEAFGNLPLFTQQFGRDKLNECLSLFYSTFTNLPVRLGDYRVMHDTSVVAEPAIVFREVDAHSALYLEIVHFLPGLSLEFLRDYDVTRRVILDDLEHQIRVAEIDYFQLYEAEQNLLKIIKKLARTIQSEDSFWTRSDDGQLILGAELAKSILRDSLADLAVDFRLFGAEKLTAYKVKAPKPKLHLRLGSGIDFLEGSAELELEGERFSLQNLLQQYRKKKYVELSDGTQAVLNQDYVNKLNRLFKKHEGGVRVSFFDLPIVDELIDEISKDSAFPRSREVFEGFNSIKSRRIKVPKLQGKLRPYQKDGLKWLDYLHERKLGGCLADDMGLGKTIQVIALLSRIYPTQTKPTLIVMPKSLLLNWRNELDHFCPSLSYLIHYGNERDVDLWGQTSLILTTYGTLRNDIHKLAKNPFYCVILDESQAIKNHQAQTSKAVMALKAEFRLAMSGTPIENNLGELYSLFHFLNPTMFSSLREFERDYLNPIQRQGDEEAASELRKKVYPFILRRLKSEVLKDLPPKVEQILHVEMSDAQKQLYENKRRYFQALIHGEIQENGVAKSQFLMLEAMLELRQIATVPEVKSDGKVVSSKWEVLEEVLIEAIAGGSKCLVFSNFLSVVEEVSTLLEKLELEYLVMTGATSNRQDLVDRFQNDERVKAMVMTLKTGGVGLNLTAADTVFIIDPWWNISAETQAVDRTHRIGQKSTVFTYRLIAKDSIEDKIRTLQLKKQALTDQIISSDGVALKSLDEHDIEFLLEA